jgi:formylglycine-generating enzyme required for sulfatase activity
MPDIDPKGLYARLGVNANATSEEIKEAYRNLVKAVHPDAHLTEDKSLGSIQNALFQSVNEAYKILSNSELRQAYDRSSSREIVAIDRASSTNPVSTDVRASIFDDLPPAVEKEEIREAGFRKPIVALLCLFLLATVASGVFFLIKQTKPKIRKPGDVFSDCSGCPQLVVLPAGAFLMGAPQPSDAPLPIWATPPHAVTIPKKFAMGIFDVTNDQYAAFLSDAIHQGKFDERWAATDSGNSHLLWRVRMVLTERGYENHPVIEVSWQGAVAYVKWLAEQTGYRYRLPTESEWEYAARAGTKTTFYFGEDILEACKYGNVPDLTWLKLNPSWTVINCNDGYAGVAPVGKFRPNSFNLYDMTGNAWQWMQDCWHNGYNGAPTNGGAWLAQGDCTKRVIRGGAFDAIDTRLGIADRRNWDANAQLRSISFRVVRELDE